MGLGERRTEERKVRQNFRIKERKDRAGMG